MSEILNENEELISLIDEDGKEVKCHYLDTIEYEGVFYCVVEPLEGGEDYEEGTCYIFRIVDNGDETVDLMPIEDEALLNAVFNAYLEKDSGEACDGDCSGCSGCEGK